MSIVDEVGADYFYSRFNGCIIASPEGNPCWISGPPTREGIPVTEVKGKPSAMKTTPIVIPKSFFMNLSFLKTPALGYRSALKGRYLSYLRRNNTSYTRGVCFANITAELSPFTDLLVNMGKISGDKINSQEFKTHIIISPEYIPVEEGVMLLNQGKILSFAINDEVAVVPASDTQYNVFLKQHKVGHLTPEGELVRLPELSDLELELS